MYNYCIVDEYNEVVESNFLSEEEAIKRLRVLKLNVKKAKKWHVAIFWAK